MDILQKAFDEATKEFIMSKYAFALIVARRLEEKGVDVTKELIDELEAHTIDNGDGTFTLQIEDGPLCDLPFGDAIEVTDDDTDYLLNWLTERISGERGFTKMVDDMAVPILDSLKEEAPKMLAQEKAATEGFELRLQERWGKAFDLFEMLIVIANESGGDFNEEYRPLAAQENNLVFDVLTRLHARACQIAHEILTLVRSGYADGAHARWRSLYEVNVIGQFIADHDNDLAERYLLHQVVISHRAALKFNAHCARLNEEPISADKIQKMADDVNELIERYGNSYGKGDYGWAASIITMPKYGSKVTFMDIEESVEFEHWKPYFTLACHNIHAGPTALSFRLGLEEDSEVLLAGASNIGFTEAIVGAAISLSQLTTCLLTTEPNIDRLVTSQVLLRLVDDIEAACQEIELNFEDETGDSV